MHEIGYLLRNSKLPGPRGNLELLYDFSKTADAKAIDVCLSCIKTDTSDSPEEFVGMCGVLGYAVLNGHDNAKVIDFLRKYASHDSWRIREAVAIGIQEISTEGMRSTLENLGPWIRGNSYEQRAVVAGLCEPKLLGDEATNIRILEILETMTRSLNRDDRLDASADSLKKALGYGWSVVVAASPEAGKSRFESLFALKGKHLRWILRENLKKNRLARMDRDWVEKSRASLTT